jgi:hypothetical protein
MSRLRDTLYPEQRREPPTDIATSPTDIDTLVANLATPTAALTDAGRAGLTDYYLQGPARRQAIITDSGNEIAEQ